MKPCEICGGKKFALIATDIREGKGRIVQCRQCGLVLQDLRWSEKKLKAYYDHEYQLTNSLVLGKAQSAAEHFKDRLKTIGPLFASVRPHLRKGMKILEVGSGPGTLLSLCRPHVAKCVGVELNTAFVEHMKRRLKMEAYAEDVNRLRLREKFDLVIMISTLDHLPNPEETMRTLKGLLAPGGKVYIEVPNREEALNFFLPEPNLTHFRKFFWHRAHLFYFTRQSIAALFKKIGLDIRISVRHDYTLKNYLHWYFLGRPQSGLVAGMARKEFFAGASDFETRMNAALEKAEAEFHKIMSDTGRGDSLCCVGRVKK